MQTFNLAIDLAGFIVCMLCFVMALTSPARHGYRMKYWCLFIAILFIFVASNMTGQLLRGVEGETVRIVLYIAIYCEFVFSVILEYVVVLWMLAILDPLHQWMKLRRVLAGLMIAHAVLILVSQFTEFTYFIDENNVYHRSGTYAVAYIIPVVMMAIGLALVARHRQQLKKKQVFVFAIYFSIPIIGFAIQLLIYGVYVVLIMTVIAAMMLLVVIMMDYTDEYYRQMEINTNLKTDIMLSQIQPHFMYNCLLVIRHICLENPTKAADALKEFTKFLRHNMESISKDTPIPFEEELEHVKCYVGLQQLRFGDDLKVEYDLECTEFQLPTLTLQPLVENAIRYGVRRREDGRGFVRVETREFDDRIEVHVIDNGPGFDQEFSEIDEGKLGIALDNVRNRLRLVCDGQFQISPRQEGGVCVVMILPKKVGRTDVMK